MGAAPVTVRFTIIALVLVVLVEIGAAALGAAAGIHGLRLTGITRLLQAVAVCIAAVVCSGTLAIIGLHGSDARDGLIKGMTWSAGFALAAGLLFLGLRMAGQNPLTLVYTPLPAGRFDRLLFFVIGGIIAPVAEEIVFRGVIFGYLRRWGAASAVLISTALFAAIHLGPALPLTQIVGGVVFALAYHTSGSLLAPILIHSLGNLAIFTLSLAGAA